MQIERGLCCAVFALLLVTPAWSEDLIIPGAGPPENVMRLLAEAFNGSQSAHRVTVPKSTGVAGALRAIDQDESVLARSLPHSADADLIRKGIRFDPFGLDAVVFVVGARVAIRALTSVQLADIFSGRLADWRELGLDPAAIRVFYREPTERSLQLIQQHLQPFRALTFSPQGKQVYRDFEVLELLDRFGSGIGFAAQSNLPSAKTLLRAIAIDGVEPTTVNIAGGRYGMVHRFGLLYKPTRLTDGARAFMAFIRTNDGRRVIEQSGVAPLRNP